jgi:hypothetical protein
VTRPGVRVSAAIISPVAGILAGILGSWLTGKWLWGVAVGVLLLIAVVAGAEAIKVKAEESEGSGKKSEEVALSRQAISIKVGRDFSPTNSVVVGGNLIQNKFMNIASGKGFPFRVRGCMPMLRSSRRGRNNILAARTRPTAKSIYLVRGVCVGESVTNGFGQTANVDVGRPPFLHIGGPAYSWEGCSGHNSGSFGSSIYCSAATEVDCPN